MEKFIPIERSKIVPGDVCKFAGLSGLVEDSQWTGQWRVTVYNPPPSPFQKMTVGWDEIFIAIPDPERRIRSPYVAAFYAKLSRSPGQHFLHNSGKIFIVYDLPLEKLCTV